MIALDKLSEVVGLVKLGRPREANESSEMDGKVCETG